MVPKVDKFNLARTTEAIVPPPQACHWLRGAQLAYVIRQHVKVAHVQPGYNAYLKLDNEMISRAPIFDATLNLKQIRTALKQHMSVSGMIHSRLMMP